MAVLSRVSYPAFPTLSRAPMYGGDESQEDGTIADSMEGGAVATRPRFTRQRRVWTVQFGNLTEADALAIKTFRNANGGWNPFQMSTPATTDGTGFEFPGVNQIVNPVRFTKLPKIRCDTWGGQTKRYSCTFEITEV